MKKYIGLLAVLLIFFTLPASGIAQEAVPVAELPVLTTSAGQSADVNTLNVVLDQAKVKYDYCDVPTSEMVSKGVGLSGAESGKGFHVKVKTDLDLYKSGTPYKTVIFAIGASLKGMGASGLTIDDEINRLTSIIEYCKSNGIFIVAVHAGGESKRGAAGSHNEKMIDAVAPFADYIIVVNDSNKDKRFTKIANDNNVPISEVKYALNIVDLVKKMFGS
ncbi:MAG: hypothetical protein GY863_13190 [bacterium]|nr:hypothetical protein [bacterium]